MNDFLPYQKRWIADTSPIKIWEKSRRIGATYVQAFEDVLDAASGKYDVWFSSKDESAGREYIRYCSDFAKILQSGVSAPVVENEKMLSFSIEMKSGKRITALSSNPAQFRSKGGKVVLDEFAWHPDADTLWSAARPSSTWGAPIRILSTHNGKQSKFYDFLQKVQNGSLKWSRHVTDIHTAVEDGLADAIAKRNLSAQERYAWLEDQRENCADEDTWLQEYCCVPVDSSTAFLTWEMIIGSETDVMPPTAGTTFVGVDVGRKNDLTVICIGRFSGGTLCATDFIELKDVPFAKQFETIAEYARQCDKLCIDATGIGMQLSEQLYDYFGSWKVEPVNFTNSNKSEMAFSLKRRFEDKTILIPNNKRLRSDLHGIRRITTTAGNTRFDADHTADGHSDRFWALALMNRAVGDSNGTPKTFYLPR